MKPRLIREIDRLADALGAYNWILVRQRRHVMVEFHFATGSVRQTFSTSPSDHRTQQNRQAELRRAVGRAAA